MPYAPGISYDSSPIGNGLAQAGGALAQAMLANAHKREEKEKWQKTIQALQPMFDQQTGGKVKLDKDTPKEAIPSLIQFAENAQRTAQEKPLRDLQMQNQQLQLQLAQQTLQQHQTDTNAARMASDPQAAGFAQQIARGANFNQLDPNKGPDSRLAAFLAAGGRDPSTVNALERLDAQAMRSNRTGPALVNLGTDAEGNPVQGVYDGNNFQRIKPARETASKVTPVAVGGRNYTLAGSHLLDEKGNPVTPPKTLDPITTQGLYSQYQNKLQEITDSPKPGLFESRKAWEQRIARLKQDVNMLASQLQQAAPYSETGETAPAAAPTKAAATPYNHADVQAELRRRGLLK